VDYLVAASDSHTNELDRMGIEVTRLPTRSTPCSNLDWAALLVAKKEKEKANR